MVDVEVQCDVHVGKMCTLYTFLRGVLLLGGGLMSLQLNRNACNELN